MGWAIAFDTTWNRDIGYSVPSVCDYPDCNERIDRGLAYVCGGDAYGGEHGCGLFFCSKHLEIAGKKRDYAQVCPACRYGKPSYYTPKPDVREWIRHKLKDKSWGPWRKENPEEVKRLRAAQARGKDGGGDVKERPILFSGEMVRAILEGRKTQTRRVVKPQPPHWTWTSVKAYAEAQGLTQEVPSLRGPDEGYWIKPSPYGQPGDRLWVRETFYCDRSPTPKTPEEIAEVTAEDSGYLFYRADGEPKWEEGGKTPWKPSIHMPRWASRLTLEVVNVRVERLQDICEADAKAEGVTLAMQEELGNPGGLNWWQSLRQGYRVLWESINGPGSWEANPWVWVVEFKPESPNAR